MHLVNASAKLIFSEGRAIRDSILQRVEEDALDYASLIEAIAVAQTITKYLNTDQNCIGDLLLCFSRAIISAMIMHRALWILYTQIEIEMQMSLTEN